MEEVFDKTPLFLLRSEMRSHSAEETIQIAEQYAKSLQKGDVVLLCGEMGAGKTVFVKGVARALGAAERPAGAQAERRATGAPGARAAGAAPARRAVPPVDAGDDEHRAVTARGGAAPGHGTQGLPALPAGHRLTRRWRRGGPE